MSRISSAGHFLFQSLYYHLENCCHTYPNDRLLQHFDPPAEE